MHVVTVVALFAFALQVRGSEQVKGDAGAQVSPIDKLTNELLSRGQKLWPFHLARLNQGELDGASLAKSGQLQSTPRRAVPVSHSPHSSLKPRVGLPVASADPPHAALRQAGAASRLQPIKAEAVSKDGKALSRSKVWPGQYRSLIERGLKGVPGDELLRMAKEDGAVVLDVRPVESFEGGTMDEWMEPKAGGVINVPLMRPVQGDSTEDNLKRLVTGFVNVKAMERNPDFRSQSLEKLPKEKPIIIVCDRGGTLGLPTNIKDTKSVDRYLLDTNRYTQSFMAAYELFEAGFTNLYFLEKGYVNWWQLQNPTPKPPYWQAFFIR